MIEDELQHGLKSVSRTQQGMQAGKGECNHPKYCAHKINKASYGRTGEHEQRVESKELRARVGQESSFVVEEYKGVRNSEKGRKQTILTSHFPTLPLPEAHPEPSAMAILSLGLAPEFYEFFLFPYT